ncbi:MAG: DUF1700 domain-containing protein [Limosilactobacillus sp.]|nr:DUF1700 domain-containing protein [Limosilactobacillus sp.]
MDQEKYLDQLSQALRRLSPDERIAIVDKYRQALQVSGDLTWDEIVNRLGGPREVAKEAYRQQRAANQTGNRRQDFVRNLTLPKIFLLMVLLLITLPIWGTITAVILAALMAIFGIVIGVIMTCVILMLTLTLVGFGLGGTSLVSGALLLMNAPLTGVYYLGLGLVELAIGLLLLPVFWLIFKAAVRWLEALGKFVTKRTQRGGNA